MPAVRVKCPGCGAPLASDQALKPGALVDCARCRLLFIPTAGDLSQPSRDETAVDAFPTAVEARPLTKPTPIRRRRPAATGGSEAVLVLIASVVMLVLAGAAIGAYMLLVRGNGPPPAAPVTTTPPAATPTTPPEPAAPTTDAEVVDPLPPKTPVPRVDDSE